MRDRRVFPSSVLRASRIELKHAGGFVQLAMRNGAWRIQQPVEAGADGTRVERLLQSLRDLKVETFGVDTPNADPAAYGLTTEDAAVQVSVWAEGEEEGTTLTLGKVTQEKSALVYARVSDVGTVCTLSNEVVAALSLKADDLRDRRICRIDPAAIVSIQLSRGERKVALDKLNGGEWLITEPIRVRADPYAVSALLRKFCAIEAVEFATGPVTNPASVGLQDAPFRLVLGMTPSAPVITNVVPVAPGMRAADLASYQFGPVTGRTVAVLHDEAAALYGIRAVDVAPILREGFERDLADPVVYMDRHILDLTPAVIRRITLTRGGREETLVKGPDGNWIVDSPPDSKALDTAVVDMLGAITGLEAERIESLAVTNAAAFGLDDSATRLTFGLTGTSGIQKTLIIANLDGAHGVHAMVQGQDTVFVLRKQTAEQLTRGLVKWQ